SFDAKTARLLSASFSSDGAQVFVFTTSTDHNNVNVWDLETGKVLTTLEGHKGWVNAIESNSSGSRFVTASWDTTAMIWDAASGRALATLEGHKGFLVISASFSPDNTRLVTVDGDGYAKVWDVTGGKLIYSFLAHSNGVSIVRF